MVGLGGLAAGGLGISIVISAVDNFSRNFAKAGAGAKSLAGVGKALTTGMGLLAVAAVGVSTAVGVGSVKAFQKAETEYAKVNTLMGEGFDAAETFGGEVERLNILLADQGGQTDVIAGLYQTMSAGITDTAEAALFMEAATKAAVGGSADLPTVIEAGTKTMAAFGIEIEDVDRVFDVFAATVQAGQTDMGQLAGAFPKVAGLAGEMGVSLEETTGIFAGLTKVLANPDVTATGMKAMLTQLLKPQEELKNGLASLGFESGKAAIESLGLMGTMEALKGTVDGDVTALGQMFGNVRAITSVLPAMGAAQDDITKSIENTANATGTVDKQVTDMEATSANAVGKMKSTFANEFTIMGEQITGVLGPKMQTLMPMITEKLIPAIQRIGEAVVSFISSDAFDAILTTIVNIVDGFSWFITLLLKGIETMHEFGQVIKEAFIQKWHDAQRTFLNFKNMFINGWKIIKTSFQIQVKNIELFWKSLWNGIVTIAEVGINSIINSINSMIEDLNAASNFLGFGDVFDTIANVDFSAAKTDTEELKKEIASLTSEGLDAVREFDIALEGATGLTTGLDRTALNDASMAYADMASGDTSSNDININIGEVNGENSQDIAVALKKELSTLIPV